MRPWRIIWSSPPKLTKSVLPWPLLFFTSGQQECQVLPAEPHCGLQMAQSSIIYFSINVLSFIRVRKRSIGAVDGPAKSRDRWGEGEQQRTRVEAKNKRPVGWCLSSSNSCWNAGNKNSFLFLGPCNMLGILSTVYPLALLKTLGGRCYFMVTQTRN